MTEHEMQESLQEKYLKIQALRDEIMEGHAGIIKCELGTIKRYDVFIAAIGSCLSSALYLLNDRSDLALRSLDVAKGHIELTEKLNA